MRRTLLLLLFIPCLSLSSQNSSISNDSIPKQDSITDIDKQRRLEMVDRLLEQQGLGDDKVGDTNPWALGGGISNFNMLGDLRSFNNEGLGNSFNLGIYAYGNYMFNPVLGAEFKVNYWKISGGALFSNEFDIAHLNSLQTPQNLFFEGTSIGAEVNGILSLSNLFEPYPEKWHVAAYLGLGFHRYDSTLSRRNPDGSSTPLLDFGSNPQLNRDSNANSLFVSTQIGVKYRFNRQIDFEIRPSWYHNRQDDLDATISNKQSWETFFVTHFGVVYKFGKEKYHTIWGGKKKEEELKPKISFDTEDDDQDGVLNKLDKEPNTPKGVKVYGNGVSVDSDDDGIPDYQDDCRFEPGPVSNQGCPIVGDRDKDGVSDRDDKCIDIKGLERFQGCPNQAMLDTIKPGNIERTFVPVPIEMKDDDGDGVMNRFDEEPNTPRGVKVYGNGVSVDSDDDGIPDYKDKCRFEFGPESNEGCPTTRDRSNTNFPTINNNQSNTKTGDEIEYSLNIYFDKNSNKIRESFYFTMLDDVASIMLMNKNVAFSIAGYTDNTGEIGYNLSLSQKRAEAARDYLISRGIEPDRIKATGYGEINPKYPNDTSEGRQLNRRVEVRSVGTYVRNTKINPGKE